MKIEFAYSMEADEVIDAEQAYDYYWAGKIRHKKSFECAAHNCTAPITCANLNYLRQDMKVNPYYKSGRKKWKHSDCCDLMKEIEKRKKNKSETGLDKPLNESPTKDSRLPDIFSLSRPQSHSQIRERRLVDSNVKLKSANSHGLTQASIGARLSAPSQYYSIRSLVSKYLKYKEQKIAHKKFIDIKGFKISYDEMFIEIGGQNCDGLEIYPRIYFGKAFIDLRKHTDYSVNFIESFRKGEQSIRPTTYISEQLISDSFTKILTREKFQDLSNKGYPSAWVFVYSCPRLRHVKKKTFINLNISNLDYFDLRENVQISP